MAQLVVRLRGRHEVVGSNPCWCVTFLAQNIPVLSGRLVYFNECLGEVVEDGVEHEVVQVSVFVSLVVRVIDEVLDVVPALQVLYLLLLSHNGHAHYSAPFHTRRERVQGRAILKRNTVPLVFVTSRDRPKSAPYPRLKNSKKTSKCQVLFYSTRKSKIFEKKFFEKITYSKKWTEWRAGAR